MPETPLAIASDTKPDSNLFAHWIPIENPGRTFADKIAPLSKTPFAQTVFLDTDTYLCEAVPELFELLDRCDIAVAHAPMRSTGKVSVPAAFSEFNTGVIVYRASGTVSDLFSRWLTYHADQILLTGDPCDQPALRRALWESDARCVVLPPEYNFRFILPSFAGRGPVKILHGRHPAMAALAAEINRSGSPRVFLPKLRDAGPRCFRILSTPGRAAGFWFGLDAFCAKWIGKIWDGLRARCGRSS